MLKTPTWVKRKLVSATTRLMFQPCFYTAITTIVAFVSLMVSGIRPVIDFGWIMTIGITYAFVISFIFFPIVPKVNESGGSSVQSRYYQTFN